MIFAQADLGQLPAGFLKEMVILTLGAIVVMAFVVSALFAALQYFMDKRRENKPTIIEPNPLPTMKIFPSATVKDLADKHDEHGRRIDGHDKEIAQLWLTMRTEDKEVRKEFADKFDSLRKELGEWTATMSRALGRLEGDDN